MLNPVELVADEGAFAAGYTDYRKAELSLRVWPGIIIQAYLYSCTACGKTVCESFQYYGEPFKPSCPEKWRVLSRDGYEQYYCSDHELASMFFVDGKQIK